MKSCRSFATVRAGLILLTIVPLHLRAQRDTAGLGAANGRDLRAVQSLDSRVRRWFGGGRPPDLHPRLWLGKPRVRRAEHRLHSVRERVGGQAVHRLGDPVARGRRQAAARRRHQEISSGGSAVRRPDDHHPEPVDAYERLARPVGAAGHRGAGPGPAGAHADDDARPRRPSENAQFSAGQRVPVQQYRIRACRHHRRAGEWNDAGSSSPAHGCSSRSA